MEEMAYFLFIVGPIPIWDWSNPKLLVLPFLIFAQWQVPKPILLNENITDYKYFN